MPYEDFYMVEEIKRTVSEKYPMISLKIYYEEIKGNFVVAINEEEVYYSAEYLKLVTEIKLNFLWKKGIYNYIFVCEDVSCCEAFSFKPDSLSIKTPVHKFQSWGIEHSSEEVDLLKSEFNATSKLDLAA